MSRFPTKVVISGQTHGNEWIGRFVVNYLKSLGLKNMFPNIDVKLILSNPKAYEINKRYVDQDLNRSFGGNPEGKINYEIKRAAEIKKEISSFAGGEDVFILDLHTTTSEMGSTIVMHNTSPKNMSVFSYMKSKSSDIAAYAWIEPEELKFLNSLSEFGFAVEVGPIAQGTLHPVVYAQTLESTMSVLGFLNSPDEACKKVRASEEVYVYKRNVDYPRDSDGNITAMIAPDLYTNNFVALKDGDFIFQNFDLTKVEAKGMAGLTPVFVNEAAYYEKSIAFSLAEKKLIKTDI
ncbi:aspartoacylase [bacterium]|nr:aspartoacylase [bacterium]